ncbi:MAG: hypothetical protein WD638_02090 [Nitriliruptoraceae bacterium]
MATVRRRDRSRASRRRRIGTLLAAGAVALTGCAASSDSGDDDQRFPDVVSAELEPSGDAWRLDATLSSPYDSPERYADAFRAAAPDGTVLGVRELAHDHANEQPFTRSLTGLTIPDAVDQITVEGRDLEHGWGGETVTVDVPG